MEWIFRRYPMEGIRFFKTAIIFGFVLGVTNALTTIVLLYETWAEDTLYDSLLRFWLLVRIFVFLIQVPPRGEIFFKLEGARSAPSRDAAVVILLDLCKSPVWKINQVFGVFLYAWFGFAFLFVYAAQVPETSGTLSALVIANIACFFLHMTLSVFWFRNMLESQTYEGAIWKRGASPSLLDRHTRVLAYAADGKNSKGITPPLKFSTCCRICFEKYRAKASIRVLPCGHHYHLKCIDPWLTKCKKVCPLCQRRIDEQPSPVTAAPASPPQREEGWASN
eukprot:CAMPEP_0184480602 /NCGR_PEP_ID=MMETSP0113_2-20130426/2099_1 /TAXON_ID=91329 /ORGANISM="Norrisiella sphaerica, Strain BC52" /LENGTH=278 /DNA_ID=CAMNT_0026859169 /DNA_START=44 /DNA_END=880 /DNA_ORIENTATION=-